MGYMKHHAIVVTSGSQERINEAAAKARSLGAMVLVQPTEVTNGYFSMLVCPDGSKDGWDESNTGDEQRAAIWFKHQPIPGWAGKTAYDLVGEGKADQVLAYLEAVRSGVYA